MNLFKKCYIWTYIKVTLMSVFFCFRCVLITNALCHLCGVATVMHSASSKKENKMGSKHFWSSGQTLYTQTRYTVYFFCFISMKTSQSLLVSKDGSKFWSSQMWQHFLTQTKHFDRECKLLNLWPSKDFFIH